VGCALVAGASYGVYVIVTKAALVRTAPLPLAGVNFGIAAIALAPALFTGDAGRQIALGWPWLLYLGAVTTAGAYAIYTIGLRDVPAPVAGVASLLEPLTATILGTLVFGERLGVAGGFGAALVFAALALLVTPAPGRAVRVVTRAAR
jgi:drug/metabolite transporter, DME family